MLRFFQEEGKCQNSHQNGPRKELPGNRVRTRYIHQIAEKRGAKDRSQRIDRNDDSEGCTGLCLSRYFPNQGIRDALKPNHAETG